MAPLMSEVMKWYSEGGEFWKKALEGKDNQNGLQIHDGFIYFDLESEEKKEKKVKPIQCEHFVPRAATKWSCHSNNRRARCTRRYCFLYECERIDGAIQWLCSECVKEAWAAYTHRFANEAARDLWDKEQNGN